MKYSNDPYWLNARYPSKCRKCGHPIKKGDRIFYYPATRYTLCAACGYDAAQEFSALAFDEMVQGG